MDQLLTILAIVIGWGLNEISHLYRSSKEHSRAISQALSILLEVRFHTIYLQKIMPVLKEQGVPEEAFPFIRGMSGDIGVDFSTLSEKYESAMEIVAQNAPLIAYEYRSKAALPNFVKKLRSRAIEEGVAPEFMESVENAISSMTIPKMDELVVELAGMHSQKTRRDVEAIVAKDFEIPNEIYGYFQNIKKPERSNQ